MKAPVYREIGRGFDASAGAYDGEVGRNPAMQYMRQVSLEALRRGLHVLVEKPMTLTSGDAWDMVEAAEQEDCVLSVAYGPRNQGKWRTAKQVTEEGLLGCVRQISVTIPPATVARNIKPQRINNSLSIRARIAVIRKECQGKSQNRSGFRWNDDKRTSEAHRERASLRL